MEYLSVIQVISLNKEIICSVVGIQEQFRVPNKNCHKISKIWREIERGSCLLLNFPFRGWTFVTFWTFTIFYELGVKPTCQSQNRNILWSKILPVETSTTMQTTIFLLWFYYIIQILMFLGALQILFAKIYVLKICRLL